MMRALWVLLLRPCFALVNLRHHSTNGVGYPRHQVDSRHRGIARSRLFDDSIATSWESREKLSRTVLESFAGFKLNELEVERKVKEEGKPDSTKNAIVSSAVAVLLGAAVLRIGGRAVLVSLLGLDMMSDLGVGEQLDQAIAFADSSGPWAFVAFLGAWVVAKTFLLDFISVALALASGLSYLPTFVVFVFQLRLPSRSLLFYAHLLPSRSYCFMLTCCRCSLWWCFAGCGDFGRLRDARVAYRVLPEPGLPPGARGAAARDPAGGPGAR